MIDRTFKRKEARRAQQQQKLAANLKKNGKLAGTFLALASSLAPFATTFKVEAQPDGGGVANSTNSYVANLASSAIPIANANNLYPSVMIAQAILESGYGSSQLSHAPYFNLFGIKGSYNGQSVAMPTKEFINGEWITINAQFRSYPSVAESFQDYAYVLSNSYYSGAWRSNTTSFRDATAYLQGRYATAPTYASVLNSIIVQYGLTKYDGEIAPEVSSPGTTSNYTAPVPEKATQAAPETSSTPTASVAESDGRTYYTVAQGDSVWKITHEFGISATEFLAWNNLNGNLLLAGQKVIVKKGGVLPQRNPEPVGQQTTELPPTPAQVTAPEVQVIPQKAEKRSALSVDFVTHTVASGDTLSEIGERYQINWHKIMLDNNLTSTVIFPGQILKINQEKETQASEHTVKPGDTLWQLAKDNQLSVARLKQMNSLTSDLIVVGQKLNLS